MLLSTSSRLSSPIQFLMVKVFLLLPIAFLLTGESFEFFQTIRLEQPSADFPYALFPCRTADHFVLDKPRITRAVSSSARVILFDIDVGRVAIRVIAFGVAQINYTVFVTRRRQAVIVFVNQPRRLFQAAGKDFVIGDFR